MQVSQMSGEKARTAIPTGRSLVRVVGRVAIWALIGLLLVRGVGAVLASSQATVPEVSREDRGVDPASAALAVRFARTYLSDPSPRALAPFLAEGVAIGGGRAPLSGGASVAQAEIAATQELGNGGEILTVASELRDARTLYLAVPVSRLRAGEVAVLGAPWIVAAPSAVGVVSLRPRPLTGDDARAIEALVEKFLPAYISARWARDLSYLLAPGATVSPLAGAVELLGAPSAVAQLGEGEGSRRTVVVSGRFLARASGAVYRLAYRLKVVRRDRWYVEGVEGALS